MCISSRHLYLRVDQHGNNALVLSGCVCVSTGLFFHDFPLHGIRETLWQGTRSRWNRPEVILSDQIYVKLVKVCAELVIATVAGIHEKMAERI